MHLEVLHSLQSFTRAWLQALEGAGPQAAVSIHQQLLPLGLPKHCSKELLLL